jgi:hypothetical protein
MIPTHPNLPVFVGWCATQFLGPMVMWKRVQGHNLEEVFEMQSRRKSKGKGVWQPKSQHVLGWSLQLFSALACLHSHGATEGFFYVSAVSSVRKYEKSQSFKHSKSDFSALTFKHFKASCTATLSLPTL